MLHSYMQNVEKAQSRLRWAQQQVSAAETALEAAQQGTTQLATCLDFLLAAVGANAPVTYREATRAGYLLHAAALASLLRDAREDGLIVSVQDDLWRLTEEGWGQLGEIAFLMREHVKKSK